MPEPKTRTGFRTSTDTGSASTPRWAILAVLIAGAVLVSIALAHPHRGPGSDAVVSRLVDPTSPAAIDALIEQIAANRVVMVGETHDRHDHHANQLAVIRGLHQRGVPIAIGMEYFQRPFQTHLDDFSAGLITEAELLERARWHERWRFDPKLYRGIFEYAQRHAIPLVALNAASETVSTVSAGGIDALPAAQRALFPPRIELAEGAYRRELEQVFAMHGPLPESHMRRFLEVQYVWDQTMARTAGDYLTANPERTLVLLAGSGHVLHDNAIPSRLRRLNPARQTVMVTDTGYMPAGAEPDYVFATNPAELPDHPAQVADARER